MRTNKKSIFVEDSLNAFVNSAINIEYVYLILTSINNFMQLQQNTMDSTLDESK